MLQNAYFLAKIGADTAENEQHVAEILSRSERSDPSRRGPRRRASSRRRSPAGCSGYSGPLAGGGSRSAPSAPAELPTVPGRVNSNLELCLFPFPVIFPSPHTARFRAIFPFPRGTLFSLNAFSSNFQRNAAFNLWENPEKFWLNFGRN